MGFKKEKLGLAFSFSMIFASNPDPVLATNCAVLSIIAMLHQRKIYNNYYHRAHLHIIYIASCVWNENGPQ